MSGHSSPQFPDPELTWKNVTVDGKKTAVFCLKKDSRGIVWLGTNSGLYFYDGVTTHPISPDDLFGAQIYAIVEKNNHLYLGGNNGLQVYDYATGRVDEILPASPKEIRTLYLIDDDIWIGSLNGIWKFDLKSDTIIDFSKGLPNKSVYSILRDSRGILYVGTYNGIARWDSAAQSFRQFMPDDGIKTPGSLFANCMLESDDRESIYIGTEGTLYRYSPSRDKWEKVMPMVNNNIKSLAQGNDGHILIGTDNGLFDMYNEGVRHYRHDTREDLSLADNEIWCILSDDNHNVWTGHERGFSIASNSNTIRTIKLSALVHSGEGIEIYSIFRDRRSNFWLAGSNGAIRVSKDSTPHWFHHSEQTGSLSHNRVRAIYEDSDGALWFATDAGINRHDFVRNRFDNFHIVDENGEHNSNWVYAFIEDGDYFWSGSFLNGLHYVERSKFNKDGGTVIADFSLNTDTELPDGNRLTNNLVNDVIKDTEGNLWILLFRDNLLTKFDISDKSLEKYNIYEIAQGYPTHIAMDCNGRIWCAFKGGAVVFTTEGNSTVIRFPHTNSDESIMSMGKVGSDMWISTQSNVWKIDGNTLEATMLPVPQKSYTAVYEDTISSKVFLGTTDEILEVDCNKVDDRSYSGSVNMILNYSDHESFNLFDIKSALKGLTLPYGGNITLVVSTLDYSPESIQRYMYKLAESPNDTIDGWIVMPEGSNTITFSDLKMGNYQVLIKTVGSPSSPVSVPLKVNPPKSLSWWAIGIYIILISAVVYLLIWYTRKKNILAFREQERQTALENVEKKLSFLSDISHDLKTPLSMILGLVSIMKEKAKDAESRKNLETIYDNAVSLNNMIHRTLELQHLEDTDENLLILSTFDVVEFCKSVFDVFQENNPNKTFVFHSSCQQLFIEADAVKFESVITNLLSNACKYSDEGATISCGIGRRGNDVEIIVSDDGIGIADIDQSLVFQRMFRAPSTSKLKEGTGLGLYLIKKYLELMNGNIELYSKEGQGTSFVVTLPLSEKDVLPVPDSSEIENDNKPKILIVEDNLQISTFISGVLKSDYQILTAENGRAGLTIASSFIPDLIIADEMMPIMSGFEMIKRLKQNPRLASVPIIMLTAKSDNRTENESIKHGVDVFMSKPFEPSALTGRISQLLKARNELKETLRIQTIVEAEARPIEAETTNEKSLAKIVKTIEENISDPDLNVNVLCEKCGIPNKQLYRLIKKYMGMTPLDYIRNVRLQKGALLLSQHRFTVAEISYMVGFKTPSYFAKCFQSQFGVKPSHYRSDDEKIDNITDNLSD